jgi:hypothetical protein
MNKAESDQIHELCSRIAVEHDQKKFLLLVEELNRLLSKNESSFRNDGPAKGETPAKEGAEGSR